MRTLSRIIPTFLLLVMLLGCAAQNGAVKQNTARNDVDFLTLVDLVYDAKLAKNSKLDDDDVRRYINSSKRRAREVTASYYANGKETGPILDEYRRKIESAVSRIDKNKVYSIYFRHKAHRGDYIPEKNGFYINIRSGSFDNDAMTEILPGETGYESTEWWKQVDGYAKAKIEYNLDGYLPVMSPADFKKWMLSNPNPEYVAVVDVQYVIESCEESAAIGKEAWVNKSGILCNAKVIDYDVYAGSSTKPLGRRLGKLLPVEDKKTTAN